MRKAGRTIDGSGLNESGHHGTTADDEMWVTSGAPPAWIEYDLGVPMTLSGFHLWNCNFANIYGNYTDRGIKDATVQTSMDGVNWSNAAGSYSPFTQANGSATYAGEDYSFSRPLLARHVKINGQNTHGGSYAGLSEIRFTTPSLITGVAATASSEYTSDYRYAGKTVDGSGMSGFGDERADTTGANMWVTNGSGIAGQWITFDLQAVHPLQALRVWNLNMSGNSDRGIDEFDIAVSLDGSTYQTLTGPSSGHFSLTEAPGAAEYLTADMIDLDGVFARHVRFTVVTNYGDGTYVGLSEVRFYHAIPEPSSIGLALLGLLALVGCRRGRRR